MKRVFLAVATAIILSSGCPAVAWSSEKAPPAVKAEFAAFFSRFKAALKANDAAAVAGMTKLPFQNDPQVSNAAQFQARTYEENFTKKTRACIQRGAAVYDRNPDRIESYAIFCGDQIFTFTRTPAGFLFTDIDLND